LISHFDKGGSYAQFRASILKFVDESDDLEYASACAVNAFEAYNLLPFCTTCGLCLEGQRKCTGHAPDPFEDPFDDTDIFADAQEDIFA
jgi:hypothetical protein